jgi:cellulose synthase/poly-beta-1,6-N-acetylglucosamine synthase-like glycosyltransferase
MLVTFWASFIVIAYTYLLYAIIIKLILPFRTKTKPVFIDRIFSVDVLVACFNEEDFVEEKIKNLLELNYSEEHISYVFITDGSTDKTVDIVTKYSEKYPQKIKLFHKDERKGKQHAINRVMPFLKSDIIVFNDCNTIINQESINHIVNHFHDVKVGVVNGEKKIIVNDSDDAVSSGEGLYWKYESFLKKTDSDFYTSVGSAGELFAIRRSLYEEVPSGISIEDFYVSMKIVLKGYRNIYEPKAYAKEYSSFSLSDEFKRKKRISAGAFKTIVTLKEIYQWKHKKVLFLYISHRVFRWTLAPLGMIALLVSNCFLEPQFYKVTFLLQIIFYLLALLGYLFSKTKIKLQILFIPFYFVFMNTALFFGFIDFLKDRNHTVWEKAQRRKS